MHDDRVHACLDGEIPRESLTGEEIRCLEALEIGLADLKEAIRSAPVPDLTGPVMAALPGPVPSVGARVARLLRWWVTPAPLRLRPLNVMVGAAVVLAGIVLRPSSSPRSIADPVAAAPATGSPILVQFRIEVPGATRVSLAGSFTAWEPQHELTEVSPGVWSALVALPSGVHDYTFVIDGSRMMADPYAPQVEDGFGGSNSRLFLAAPGGSV